MSNGKYISKKDGKYLIQREFDGVEYFFGEFSTFDEAISKREWLDSHGWPVSLEVLEKMDSCVSNENNDLKVYDPQKVSFTLNNASYKLDILNILKDIKFVKEDQKIPFPQSDDLNRFIFIGQNLLEGDMNKEDIKRTNQIGGRIVNMYVSTGFYFGAFEKYRKNNQVFYKLSDKGKQIFQSDEYDRNLSICHCILEHEIFYRIFLECFFNRNVNKKDIVNIMLQYDLNLNSMVTIERRAGCVSSWMHWIFRLMGLDI